MQKHIGMTHDLQVILEKRDRSKYPTETAYVAAALHNFVLENQKETFLEELRKLLAENNVSHDQSAHIDDNSVGNKYAEDLKEILDSQETIYKEIVSLENQLKDICELIIKHIDESKKESKVTSQKPKHAAEKLSDDFYGI